MEAVNQYGERITLPGIHPRKELLEALGATHAERVYVDKRDGSTKHVGYVIRGGWWTLYTVERWERDA